MRRRHAAEADAVDEGAHEPHRRVQLRRGAGLVDVVVHETDMPASLAAQLAEHKNIFTAIRRHKATLVLNNLGFMAFLNRIYFKHISALAVV